MSQLKQEKKIHPVSDFLWYSVSHRLDDVHMHCGRQSSSLSLPIQKLLSSGNTLRDTTRNKDFTSYLGTL